LARIFPKFSKKREFLKKPYCCRGAGLHKFSLSLAVLPQHLQINCGFEANAATFSKSNSLGGWASLHILFSGTLSQQDCEPSQHSFAMLFLLAQLIGCNAGAEHGVGVAY